MVSGGKEMAPSINELKDSLCKREKRALSIRSPLLEDVLRGVKKSRVALLLAFFDLRLKYRRSYLGPFWVTLSMTLMIYSMGFVYGKILRVDSTPYLLYLACGVLSWQLLSSTLSDMASCFTDAAHLILQVKLPYSLYILRIVLRNLMLFGHNLLALIPLLIVFRFLPSFSYLSLALFLSTLALFSFGTLFALMGARFRDVQQVMTSLLQLCFLLTPIMWEKEKIMGKAKLLVYLNPFYYFVELIRHGLMGLSPPPLVIKGGVLITCGGFLLLLLTFPRLCHRIPFWL